MVKGGRWIASFNVAIRDFNVKRALGKDRYDRKHRLDLDTLIYGGVRQSGFVLSRAFSFVASPTYVVACAMKHLDNARNTKWSKIINLIRQATVLMEVMEFEWAWLLLFGEEKLPTNVAINLESHHSRTLGLLYADVKNKTILKSDTFISRRGEKIFHPKNIDKKKGYQII
jgi:hypothetical protein